MMQPGKWLALEQFSEFGRRRLNGRGERARRHHVHRAGEPVLAKHLPAWREEERQCHLCVLHEVP